MGYYALLLIAQAEADEAALQVHANVTAYDSELAESQEDGGSWP